MDTKIIRFEQSGVVSHGQFACGVFYEVPAHYADKLLAQEEKGFEEVTPGAEDKVIVVAEADLPLEPDESNAVYAAKPRIADEEQPS